MTTSLAVEFVVKGDSGYGGTSLTSEILTEYVFSAVLHFWKTCMAVFKLKSSDMMSMFFSRLEP